MNSYRSSLASLLSVAGLLVVASSAGCGGDAASHPETTSETSSALSICSASTSCAGIIGAPPELTVSCGEYMLFYSISPAGTWTALGGAMQQYSVSESDYAGQLAACTLNYDTRQCEYFSTYAPPSSWCPGGGGSSSSSSGGGGSSGGKGGCHGGICQ